MAGELIVREVSLWRALTRRFKLRTGTEPQTPVVIGKTVQVITSIDDVLALLVIDQKAVNVSAGAATAFTVPDGKVWTIRQVQKATTVGTPAVRLQNVADSASIELMVGSTSPTTVTGPWRIGQGQKVVLAQGNVADISINVYILYEEVDGP